MKRQNGKHIKFQGFYQGERNKRRGVREVDRKMARVFAERELRMRWNENERKIRGMKPEMRNWSDFFLDFVN